jgi:hypothetical protein
LGKGDPDRGESVEGDPGKIDGKLIRNQPPSKRNPMRENQQALRGPEKL